jgi:TetR/AcrR family transcriptional repressor of nem operon
MPRASPASKALAAARFRESGVGGIGVADLMKDAGLTHGGFYRHFAWHDELVAEAIERALSEGARAVAAMAKVADRPWRRWWTRT